MDIIIEDQKQVDYEKYSSLNTTININKEIINLTLQVPSEYSKYLTNEICDNVLYLLLPMAMINNFNIVSNIPISKHFLHNINEIYIPSFVLGNPKLGKISIKADTICTDYDPSGVGTAVTSGIDSTYTILKYRDVEEPFKITHLFICNSSIDLGYQNEHNVINWDDSNPYYFGRAYAISKHLNLPVIKIYSNYLKFLCFHPNGIRHLNCHHYITLAHILALKKLLKLYYFSGERPLTNFSLVDALYTPTTKQELLCNLVLTHDKFFCHNTGIDANNRIDKIPSVIKSDLKQFLHPCFKKTEKNCCKYTCKKCLHMLCSLDYLDMLDDAKTIYDVDSYRKNKIIYFKSLTKMKENIFLNHIYNLMYEKYPKKMKIAES